MKQRYYLLLWVFGIVGTLQAQPFYSIGTSSTKANGISSDGNYVVGNAENHSFVWTAANGLTERDQTRVNTFGDGTQVKSINPTGRLLGITPFPEIQALNYNDEYSDFVTAGFSQVGSTNWTVLPQATFSGNWYRYGFNAQPYSITDDGTRIFGGVRPAREAERLRAAYWDLTDPANPTYTVFHNDYVGTTGSCVLSASGNGNVLGGYAATAIFGTSNVAIWINNSGTYTLQNITGNPVGQTNGISNNGNYAAMDIQITATLYKAAFYKISTDEMIIIDNQDRNSVASAVSNNGIVVGYLGTANAPVSAFIYSETTGMLNFADYLTANNIDFPSNFQFLKITGISADGTKVCGIGNTGSFFVEIPIPTAPGNFPVTNLTIESTDYQTIELSWTIPTGNPALSGFNIYQSNTDALLQSVSATSSHYIFTDLADGSYQYTVKAVYGSALSEPSNIAQITIGKVDFPFSEPFNYPEHFTDPNTIALRAAKWDVSSNTIPMSASWYISQSGIPPNCASFINPISTNFSESLSSPYMDVPAGQNLYLSFNVVIAQGNNTAPEAAKMAVELFVNGTWINIDEYQAIGPSYQFQSKSYDISQYAGNNNIRIRFRCHGNSSDDLNWFVDNVELTSVPFVNNAPTIIEAHEEDSTRHVNWTDPNGCLVLRFLQDNATYWTVGNDGIPFIAANKYTAADLLPFQNYKLYSLSFYRTKNDGIAGLTDPTYNWFAMQDGIRIFNQPVINPQIGWNHIVLNTPIDIDNTKDLYYGIEVVTHHQQDMPIGAGSYYIMTSPYDPFVDLTVFDGRGNIFSEDGGLTWQKLSDFTNILPSMEYELFNIEAILTPNDTTIPSNNILGYRLTRNGENVAHTNLGVSENSLLLTNHQTDWLTFSDSIDLCYNIVAVYTNQVHSDSIESCIIKSDIKEIINTNNHSIRLFPVPLNNSELLNIQIYASPEELQNATIEIYNVLGIKTAEYQVKSTITQIPVSLLSDGIYILKVKNGKTLNQSVKFIIGQ